MSRFDDSFFRDERFAFVYLNYCPFVDLAWDHEPHTIFLFFFEKYKLLGHVEDVGDVGDLGDVGLQEIKEERYLHTYVRQLNIYVVFSSRSSHSSHSFGVCFYSLNISFYDSLFSKRAHAQC